MTKLPPLTILDLASVGEGETIAESFAGSVALARLAEDAGYRRVWYAEHHSIGSIASSATAVLIAHIAAHTGTIGLGAGGIMLPNHSPLVIAEQFGTLATLHPGRIDLGLGRAPGSDQATARALRRDPSAADTFPQDVMELRGLLGDESPIPGVHAIPGEGTHVPLSILGSSLYGAQVAALLGLPYAFASHFAPQALHAAIRIYRERFRPSPGLAEPYVMAGVNVIAADTEEEARAQLDASRRARVKRLFARGDAPLTDAEVDVVLASPRAAAVDEMLTYTAVGTPPTIAAYLDGFARDTGADELVVVHHARDVESRLRSVELLADAIAVGAWRPSCPDRVSCKGVRMGLFDKILGGADKVYDLKTDAEYALFRDRRYDAAERLAAKGDPGVAIVTGIRGRFNDSSTDYVYRLEWNDGEARDGAVHFGAAAPLGLRVGSEVRVRTDGRSVVLDPAAMAANPAAPGTPGRKNRRVPDLGVDDTALDMRILRKLKKWPPARATIVSWERTSVLGIATDNWNVVVTTADGTTASESRDNIPPYARWYVHPGSEVPVVVDPKDPTRIQVDWPRVAEERAGGSWEDAPPDGSIAAG